MKQEIKERIEKIRKGEVPDGYRINKFGIYPEDWIDVPFNQIFDLEGGFTASRNDLGDEGIAYLHYGDIHKSNKNFIDVKKELSGIPKIDLNITKIPKKHLLKDGYVVFADASEDYEGIGKSVTIFNPDEIPFINGLHTIVAIPKNGTLNKNYSRFFLLEQSIRKQRTFYAQGISVLGISKGYLKKIVAHIPSDIEQKKISKILSTWDKAIELKEKLITEKKEFKRGLMQKLLVGKIRFNEYIKNPNLQEVKRYSTLPEDWSAKKASSIFSNVSIKNNDNEQLLSATQNNGVIPRDMLDGDVMSPSGGTKGYKLVEDGDFVISLRSFQGGIEYSSYRGLISPAYTVMKNKNPICKDFYRYIFKSKLFIDRLASSVIGIRDGKQISYDDFSFMFLPYPELKEQEKIAFTLKNLDDNIELLELELNQLKEQKRGLMQLLLTGVVRVEVN